MRIGIGVADVSPGDQSLLQSTYATILSSPKPPRLVHLLIRAFLPCSVHNELIRTHAFALILGSVHLYLLSTFSAQFFHFQLLQVFWYLRRRSVFRPFDNLGRTLVLLCTSSLFTLFLAFQCVHSNIKIALTRLRRGLAHSLFLSSRRLIPPPKNQLLLATELREVPSCFVFKIFLLYS